MLGEQYPKTATLKDGRTVVIRPLTRNDFDKLYTFFQALPEEDRLFLRHDVTDPEVVGSWVENIDFRRVVALVAEDADRIVADGTLHMALHGWSRHVGHLRLVTARTHRNVGLGTVLARELVAVAERNQLEKVQAQVIEDNIGSVKMFEHLGFHVGAVLPEMVRDQKGNRRNLAIMISNVPDLTQTIEKWILESMQAAYRVPGEGLE